jgi:mRNA interferase MazF
MSLDPRLGREQGRRPFLILSRRAYNAKTSLAVGVPITSARKGYPFETPLPRSGSIAGVALVDQINSVDWRSRQADFAEETSPATLRAVRSLLTIFLELA